MAAKVCPRCGALYQNLKSATCPQCFAHLTPVDEATVEELAAARASLEQSPEYVQEKAVEDEQWREQSFGACLGVVVIGVLTLVLTVVLIVVAVRRYNHPHPTRPGVRSPLAVEGSEPDLSHLLRPAAGASLDEVLPPTLGGFVRRSAGADVTLPGTLTSIYQAVYGENDDPAQAVDAYALPVNRPTDEQNAFRLGVTLAARLNSPQAAPPEVFATEHWRYAVVGAAAARARFRQAAAIQFRRP